MEKFDKIGVFKGKPISKMTRDELLDFASFASQKIQELEQYKVKSNHLLLESKELLKNIFHPNKKT